MSPVNYAKLAVALSSGTVPSEAAAIALAEIVIASAEGASGLKRRVDPILERLAEKIPQTESD